MSSLKNIKAITEMINGAHKTQTRNTIGFSDTASSKEKNKRRDVGEKWNEYDSEGNVIAIWEQMKGWRRKLSPYDDVMQEVRKYLNSYPNCLDDCNTSESDRTRLDERFRAKFGRCADCQFRLESLMKNEGTYKEYERQQMANNAKAFFIQADKELELTAEQLRTDTTFTNVDGKVETWKSAPQMADQLLTEYAEYKKMVLEHLKEEEG